VLRTKAEGEVNSTATVVKDEGTHLNVVLQCTHAIIIISVVHFGRMDATPGQIILIVLT
jgi:hypothetical protein